MTSLQKNIIRHLLEGGGIAGSSKYGYRLRDSRHAVILAFTDRTFSKIKNLLRKEKNQWVINKGKVRQLHGSCYTKKLYKKLKVSINPCEPCTYKPIKIKKKNGKIKVFQDSEHQLQIFK